MGVGNLDRVKDHELGEMNSRLGAGNVAQYIITCLESPSAGLGV